MSCQRSELRVIDSLSEWEKIWQMEYNVDKYEAIHFGIEFKSREVMLQLYSTLVRPHLEYNMQFSSSYLRKDVLTLEELRRRFRQLRNSLGKEVVSKEYRKGVVRPAEFLRQFLLLFQVSIIRSFILMRISFKFVILNFKSVLDSKHKGDVSARL
eukprot:g32670.t1